MAKWHGYHDGSDVFLALLGWFVCAVLAVGILAILFIETGFIKSEITVNLELPQDSAAQPDDMKLVALEYHDFDQSTRKFGDDGTAVLRLKSSTYSLYVSYDGMLEGVESLALGKVDSRQVTAWPEFVRVLILRLRTEEGNLLTAGEFTVTDGAGTKIPCSLLEGGTYVLHLPDDAEGMVLHLSVPGYKELEMAEDWNDARLGIVEVTLVDAQ